MTMLFAMFVAVLMVVVMIVVMGLILALARLLALPNRTLEHGPDGVPDHLSEELGLRSALPQTVRQ